jgi:hypothetical protein
VPAIPVKPRTPAINPITKNVIDQLSIRLTSFNKSLLKALSNADANRSNQRRD